MYMPMFRGNLGRVAFCKAEWLTTRKSKNTGRRRTELETKGRNQSQQINSECEELLVTSPPLRSSAGQTAAISFCSWSFSTRTFCRVCCRNLDYKWQRSRLWSQSIYLNRRQNAGGIMLLLEFALIEMSRRSRGFNKTHILWTEVTSSIASS